MRILYLISTIDPAYGGPVEGLRHMSNHIQTLGHTVDVITLDIFNYEWKSRFSCNVIFLGPSHFSYKFNFRLINWLKKNFINYDYIIINGLWQYIGLAVWLVNIKHKFPYFIYTHGMLDPWFKYKYPLKHLKKFVYWCFFEKNILNRSKSVLFTSEEEKILSKSNFFGHNYHSTVINFGIPGFNGNPITYKNFFFREYPHLVDEKFLLYLGRIHPKKGIDILLNSISLCRKNHPNLVLLILGPDDNAYAKSLKRLSIKLGINNNIHWGGMVSDELKWGAFLSADVFVLPSHSENFGAVIPEALSCGLPVLTTNKVNIWRDLVLKNTGFVSNDTIEGVVFIINKWLMLKNSESSYYRKNSKICFDEFYSIKSAAINLLNKLNSFEK